jgi:uncharacterized membrane protein YeaQ/YmgE (transglycosylase-associated protein family)
MAGRRVSRGLLLGVVLGVVGLLAGTWVVTVIDNSAVSITWSLLVVAVLVGPVYPRRWWPRSTQHPLP